MAYDEGTAQRIREMLADRGDVIEKKMFGGLCFMVSGNMCVGVEKNRIMLRVGPEQHETLLAKPHVAPMDFTGKPMKGFLYLASEGFKKDKELGFYVQRCLDFVLTLPPKKDGKKKPAR